MNKDELRIRIIPEDGQVLIETHTDGIVKCKEIQEDALLDCLKNSIQHNHVSSGLLPPNCIHVGIDSDGNKSYCLWYPRLYADISYHETAYPSFPLPRLVFAFHVDTEGKIGECRMGVVADEMPTMETVMYCYPFSNVSRFSLCTGAKSLPHIQSLQQLSNLPYYILSLPDNDDHYTERHNRLNLGHRDLLEHLRDKDRKYYYEQFLVPMPNTTLKNFI